MDQPENPGYPYRESRLPKALLTSALTSGGDNDGRVRRHPRCYRAGGDGTATATAAACPWAGMDQPENPGYPYRESRLPKALLTSGMIFFGKNGDSDGRRRCGIRGATERAATAASWEATF